MSISTRTLAIAGGIAAAAGFAYFAFGRTQGQTLQGRQLLRSSHTMNVEPYDAFLKWRDLSGLPSVLEGIGSVKKLDNGHWRYSLAGAGKLEVEIANEQPGHVIEWRSIPGSKIDARGIVRFTRKRNGHGTKVHMEVLHQPAA